MLCLLLIDIGQVSLLYISTYDKRMPWFGPGNSFQALLALVYFCKFVFHSSFLLIYCGLDGRKNSFERTTLSWPEASDHLILCPNKGLIFATIWTGNTNTSVFISLCIKISCMNSKRKLYYHFDRNVFQKCTLRLLLLLIDFGLTPWRKMADGKYCRRRECWWRK